MKDASAIFGIPVSTITDKKLGNFSLSSWPGPSCALSVDREEHIVNYLLKMSKIGYGVSKKELPLLVKKTLDAVENECIR